MLSAKTKTFIYTNMYITHRMKKAKLKSKPTWNELIQEIKEAQKDPEFIREVKKFIKATT